MLRPHQIRPRYSGPASHCVDMSDLRLCGAAEDSEARPLLCRVHSVGDRQGQTQVAVKYVVSAGGYTEELRAGGDEVGLGVSGLFVCKK